MKHTSVKCYSKLKTKGISYPKHRKKEKVQSVTSLNTPDGILLLILGGNALCKESAFVEILENPVTIQ